MIRLTDEEIGNLLDPDREYKYPRSDGSEVWLIDCRQVAKATLKKVVEWGEEECTGHGNYQYSLKRRQCAVCWQALCQAAGLERDG